MSVATIGSALAEKRSELGLEKGQAADKIGMSRTTYSSYEQDAQRPSVDVFPALAEFLSVSMEELLALYGATCVAAIRPALERLLLDRPGDSDQAREADGPAPRADDLEPEVAPAWTATPGPSAAEFTPNATSLEPGSISAASVDPDEDSGGPSPDFAEEKLELPETQLQSDSEEQESFSSDSSGWSEPIGVPGSPDSPNEPPAWLDPLPQSGDSQDIGSVVFEPSPYFIRTSITESAGKTSDAKKKKKKKKKNKSK